MNIEISQETKNNDEVVKLRTEEGIKDALKKRILKSYFMPCFLAN